MLWLPHPVREPSLPPVAVADSSVLALEWLLLEPDAAHSRWQISAALVADPWFVAWIDRLLPDIESSRQNCVTLLCDSVESLVEGWSNTENCCWLRLQSSQCRDLAHRAISIVPKILRTNSLSESHWSDYVTDCRRALQGVATTGRVSTSLVSRYLTEHPGIERRVPALARRIASSAISASYDVRLRDAKLAALQELAYGASHEINNPLANIAGRAQSLLADEQSPDRRRALSAIYQQSLRAHEMISDLMLFAQPPVPVMESLSLGDLLAKVARELEVEVLQRSIDLHLDVPRELPAITGDATQLGVALRAGVVNAIEAIGHGGRIIVAGEYETSLVRVRILDTGPGLNDREIEHAFDPFFSGREAGRGLGFGLTKCWRIVAAHHGSVTIANREVMGAELVIELPLTTLGDT